jgi:hypothetical protein
MVIIIAKGKANCGVKRRQQNGLDAAGVVRYYACLEGNPTEDELTSDERKG